MCIDKGFSLREPYSRFQARELTRACNSIKEGGESSTEELVVKIQALTFTHDVKNPVLLKKVLKGLQPKEEKKNEHQMPDVRK